MIACLPLALALALTPPRAPLQAFAAGQEEEVAFWVRMRGSDLPEVPVLMSEWNECIATERRLRQVNDEGPFFLSMLTTLVEIRLAQLYHHDGLAEAQKRVEEVAAMLARDKDPERMVRRYSDDSATRQLGGKIGRRTRNLFEYPAIHELYHHEPGTWVGPLWGKNGAEFYYILSKAGEPDRLDAHLDSQILVVKYRKGEPISSRLWIDLWRKASIRTDHEHLRLLLPPGMQDPPPVRYGPDDVAPLGDPEQPLMQFSLDPALHGKPNQPFGGHRKVEPDGAGSGKPR